MEIPGDVLYGDVLVRLTGNREAIIENYKGIYLYTSDKIIVIWKNRLIEINGCKLHIEYFSGADMKITGTIETISYRVSEDLCC